MPELMCAGCRKKPEELSYPAFCEPDQTPDEYVWDEEGTLDRATGAFLCDSCYIKHGMPSSPRGWTATPEHLLNLLLFGIEE